MSSHETSRKLHVPDTYYFRACQPTHFPPTSYEATTYTPTYPSMVLVAGIPLTENKKELKSWSSIVIENKNTFQLFEFL